MAKRYDWIGVACKDRIFINMNEGFVPIGHSKRMPLQNLCEGAWLIYDSLHRTSQAQKPYENFTATDEGASNEWHPFDLSEEFALARFDADFECNETALDWPLSEPFSQDNRRWKYPAYLENLEISEDDFDLLAEEMEFNAEAIKH